MLISPTEPPQLRALGKVSSAPEKLGADVLIPSQLGLVGVQRKEVSDLIASVKDGRLAKELGQMRQLSLGVLLIEGRLRWTSDGSLLNRSPWTRAQHLGLMWSVQSKGYWIGSSESLDETCEWLSAFTTWIGKRKSLDEGSSLDRRPKAQGEWGNVSNREWGIHFLQGLPGLGPQGAGELYDKFGSVPMQWTVTEMDLQQVKGIGSKRAEVLYRALGGNENGDTSGE